MINILLSIAGYLSVYHSAPFMVVSSECGEQRPIYGGVYSVEGYDEEVYNPTWVAKHSLRIGLSPSYMPTRRHVCLLVTNFLFSCFSVGCSMVVCILAMHRSGVVIKLFK
jgi:hypothetical protein